MTHKLKSIMVELNTPKGSVFSGETGGVELRTTDGVIAINPQEVSYLHLTQTTHITLRIGSVFRTFDLENAAASLREGRLTVLAEEIHEVEPATG